MKLNDCFCGHTPIVRAEHSMIMCEVCRLTVQYPDRMLLGKYWNKLTALPGDASNITEREMALKEYQAIVSAPYEKLAERFVVAFEKLVREEVKG